MNLKPIYRKIVLGAAEASLDIAGAALLPGAWPILKAALKPVLERVKERLGGEDITKSVEMAQKAVNEFENDPHLQEMLRSNLLDKLDALVQGQQQINDDVQKLMLVVTGDQKLLREIVGGVERIERKIEEGVNLSDEAVEKLTQSISRQAENSRQIRSIALREMGPVGQLIERQVSRLQLRAVELIDEQMLDRASDELQEGLLLISALLNEAPTDMSLQLQLGFIYKTTAQVFQAAGKDEQADTYIQKAEQVFYFVKDEVAGNEKTALDVANAIHGLGNMHSLKGNLETAIENYKLAASLHPGHCYTWHDMFISYYELTKQGQLNLPEMTHALERLKHTGKGQPGLGAKHIARLEAMLKQVEKTTVSQPGDNGDKTTTAVSMTIVRIIPRALALVIGEADPYATFMNFDCEIVNQSSDSLLIMRIELKAIDPVSGPLKFKWRIFYNVSASNLPDGRTIMTKTAEAGELKIEPKSKIALGIQFAGPVMDPDHIWAVGDYDFELRSQGSRQGRDGDFDIKTKFAARITAHESNQIQHWVNATKADWDQLNDPDRAVGIPIRIK